MYGHVQPYFLFPSLQYYIYQGYQFCHLLGLLKLCTAMYNQPCTVMYSCVQLSTYIYNPISSSRPIPYFLVASITFNRDKEIFDSNSLTNTQRYFTTLCNHVQLCTPMYNCVQLCTTVYNHVQLCTTMYNCVQLFTTMYNHLQLKQKIGLEIGLYMVSHGCTGLFMVVHGCSWLYMVVYGCTWSQST